MSVINIAIPSLPDVPNVLGVPNVLRNPQAALNSFVNSQANVLIGSAQQAVNGVISNVQKITNQFGNVSSLVNGAFGILPIALTADAIGVFQGGHAAPSWYIAGTDKKQVLFPDSFKELEYKHEWRLPNYPQEMGSFQTYNKVDLPYDLRITMTKGGSRGDTAKFLSSVQKMAESTDLFTVYTPNVRYENLCVQSYSQRRTATNGVTMLTVEIVFLKIRQATSATFTNTNSTPAVPAQPNGASQMNTGLVQAQAVTSGNSNSIASITAGVTGGVSLISTIKNSLTLAPSSLSSNIVSSFTSTINPGVNLQINSIANSFSPISGVVALQASSLLHIA